MAHSLSAQKRVRQNATQRSRNRWRLVSMRKAIKDFEEQLLHGTPAKAREAFQACTKLIDRTAQKGVIHRNQASRRKSRLSARLKTKEAGPKGS